MTEQDKQDWVETWQGRTAKLPGQGEARLRCQDGKVTASATWPGGRGGLQGDCGAPGKAAEGHWFAFLKFAARHALSRHQPLGKGKAKAAPRGGPRFRQQVA